MLRVRNLSKYFGGLAALKNLSFDFKRGEVLGIIGPNGAGKTTAFNLINGYLKPDSGTIEFEGMRIDGLTPYQISKKGIARTFQIVRVFPNISVFDHVLTGAITKFGITTKKEKLEQEVMNILEFTGLKGKKDMIAKDLTIAYKKRLELATALITKPKLLLLDELMAGLNPVETTECMDLLERIYKEMDIGLIIVEHVMKVVMELCHRIIVLHYGEKIAEGTPEEVANNRKVIEAYLGEEIYA